MCKLHQCQSGSMYVMPVVRMGGTDDEHTQAAGDRAVFCLASPSLRWLRPGKVAAITTPVGPSPKFRITLARKKPPCQRNPARAGATIILVGPNPKCPITSGPRRRIDWKAPPPRDRVSTRRGPDIKGGQTSGNGLKRPLQTTEHSSKTGIQPRQPAWHQTRKLP